LSWKIIDQIDAANQSWERYRHNLESEWGLAGIDIGHHDLNMMIGGLQGGYLTTIAARSGHGKTALTVQMFEKGSKKSLNGKRAEFLFCTWEMHPSYLIDRHVAYRTGLTLRRLSQGAKLLTNTERKLVEEAYGGISDLKVNYQYMSLNINDLRIVFQDFVEKCRAMEQVEGTEILPVVVIDYIGLALFENSGLRTYGISDFLRSCKQMANNESAAFVVFAQINRGADDRDIPNKNELSDSQSIENTSDNLILLHRPEYVGKSVLYDPELDMEVDARNKAIFRVWKSRQYGTGDVVVSCDIPRFRFWSQFHTWDYGYEELYGSKEFWVEKFGLKE